MYRNPLGLRPQGFFLLRRTLVSIALASVAVACGSAIAKAPTRLPTVRVAIYTDEGAAKSAVPNLKRCLASEFGFEYEFIVADDIRGGVLDRFDVVLHPGGSGRRQAESLGQAGRKKVRDFVADGGGYVGICAGVYLASAHYPWSLGLIDAKVFDREHWDRGTGDVEVRLVPAAQKLFGVDEEIVTIYYGQGPLLCPAGEDSIVNYEPLAVFETEIAKTGAPKGVMKGTTAIARAPFGRGRVIAISPHPEKTPGRDDFIRRAVRWTVEGDQIHSRTKRIHQPSATGN